MIIKLLDEFNPEYCDADKLVHTLYEPGKPAYYRIIEIFGQEIVNEKTSYINRQKLGEIVFKDKNSMKKLTDAIGNIGIEVKNLVDSWIEDSKKLGIVEAVNLIAEKESRRASLREFLLRDWRIFFNPASAASP